MPQDFQQLLWFLTLVFAVASGFLLHVFAFSPFQEFCVEGVITPVFSPGADKVIVPLVDAATKTIDVELYQFSFSGLKGALARAVERGVRVRVVLEPRVSSNYATAEFLSENGVLVKWASREFSNTHSKFAVFDSEKVLVGSINWSRHAMKFNREAAILLQEVEIAESFKEVFEQDWSDASFTR